MLAHVATLYGARMPCWPALDRERGAHVQHVRRPVLALELVDGVELVLAGAVRIRVVDLDAVLGGEVLHDRAVVGPVGRQRYDVERAFLLGRRDQRVHAAASGNGGGRGPVGPAAGVAARAAAA